MWQGQFWKVGFQTNDNETSNATPARGERQQRTALMHTISCHIPLD
jgi:hypothetical protein